MKIYNKLVRDNIPQVCKKDNQVCHIRILSDQEYLVELNKKMQEELKEYLESGEIEELADLEEVLRAILETKQCSYDEFEKIRLNKVSSKGSFKNKIYLESIEYNK